ncbi:MAG: CDP-glucose 4,6-dehydratase [Proteobacteria bacterium]|nr:CDP-glucose 4,6-dehydratase [Pseudomonadota bacterium]MDA0891152.1 CDP-glucose 4,6-dehydratase [Pseudomonadota bacterium]
MSAASVATDFWKDKAVLVTGHTGFKGAWLSIWLTEMGARVMGISLHPNTDPCLYSAARVDQCISRSCLMDICDLPLLKEELAQFRPEIVFHLAAQALVRASYERPIETLTTNVMGTANVLDAMKEVDSVEAAVMVTTDKVYRNEEWVWPYRETDPLGGIDPYSASKAACELVISSYTQTFFKDHPASIASARAGNVIGGGDWATDRLFPDMFRTWGKGHPLQIRSAEAVRPWQHVLEPLRGYMILAEKLYKKQAPEGPYNFGPSAADARPVKQVVGLAEKAWGAGARTEYVAADSAKHEAQKLALDTSKAADSLGIQPIWSLDVAAERTINWYKRFLASSDARELCLADIELYVEDIGA